MVLGLTIPYLDSLLELPGGQITAFTVVLIALTAVFQLALMVFLRLLRFIVGKTQTTLDDRLLRAAGKYLPLIAFFTSLYISLEAVYPEIQLVQGFTDSDLYIIVMLAIAGFLLGSLADQVMLWYGTEIRPRKKGVQENEVFPFVRGVIKITVVLVFIVFVLQRLGFDTTAIITGLGIGGLAVALALQDTLANFFAGVHILVDKPFREDDFIKLDNGIEGTVVQIGWRTTRIITMAMNEVIVPNSKLAGAILENYSSPRDLSGVLYTIGVDYREDIDRVEKIITDSLKAVAKRSPIMDGDSVWVRFDSFGDFSLNFKFGYLIKGYINRFAVYKEVNRELFYAFKKMPERSPLAVPFVPPTEPPPKKKGKR